MGLIRDLVDKIKNRKRGVKTLSPVEKSAIGESGETFINLTLRDKTERKIFIQTLDRVFGLNWNDSHFQFEWMNGKNNRYVESYAPYDFKVDFDGSGILLDVKTTSIAKKEWYVSANELQKTQQILDNGGAIGYGIILLMVNKDKTKVQGAVIPRQYLNSFLIQQEGDGKGHYKFDEAKWNALVHR